MVFYLITCRSKESLMKHMQFNCPRKYECGKCLIIFKSFGELTHHEGNYHNDCTFKVLLSGAIGFFLSQKCTTVIEMRSKLMTSK